MHAGLKEYPNYMMGGGYVMGGEVARVLVDVHSRMHLKVGRRAGRWLCGGVQGGFMEAVL